MSDLLSRPHWVYRAWDADGRLLYIGCTSNLAMRRAKHRSRTAWWPQVARFESVELPNGWDALQMERLAIISENPAHNILHKQTPEDPRAAVIDMVIRMGITPAEIEAAMAVPA